MNKIQLFSKDRKILLGWLDHFFNLYVSRDYTGVRESLRNRFRIGRFVPLTARFVYKQQKNCFVAIKSYSSNVSPCSACISLGLVMCYGYFLLHWFILARLYVSECIAHSFCPTFRLLRFMILELLFFVFLPLLSQWDSSFSRIPRQYSNMNCSHKMT